MVSNTAADKRGLLIRVLKLQHEQEQSPLEGRRTYYTLMESCMSKERSSKSSRNGASQKTCRFTVYSVEMQDFATHDTIFLTLCEIKD